MQSYSDSTAEDQLLPLNSRAVPIGAVAKKTFSLTLNVMRLFELKFGVHVHQEVRFKILQLHTSKKLPYLCNPPCIREVLC